MSSPSCIVGIGGTTRAGSSSERLVRCVLSEAEMLGADTRLFGGEALSTLPHYAPENSARSPEQLDLLVALRQADGVVIGTPAYHGGVSGLVKNALDLTEDMRDDSNSYFSGRAVGTVVTAAGWQACGGTLQALRGIVHALRGWPTPIGISVNTSVQEVFDGQGNIIDPALLETCKLQAEQIMSMAESTH